MDSYKFSTDYFSSVHKNFEAILSDFKGKDNLKFLEIGSYEGRSAAWMLEHILTGNNNKLFCVELYVLPRLENNLKGFGNKVEIFQGRIFDFYKYCNEQFDFIYIDGCHIGASVLADAVMSFEMLKVGGIMLFDDYEYDQTPIADKLYDTFKDIDKTILTPKFSINNFIRLYSQQCVELHLPNDYQTAIGKIYNSFLDNQQLNTAYINCMTEVKMIFKNI